MIVDSSAIIAILRGEPEADEFLHAMSSTACRMSVGSYLEAAIVADSARSPALSRYLDDLVNAAELQLEPMTLEQAQVARQAYRDYGRGSGHPAGLNFGDCFAYALARTTREPLLFKGDDFNHTDVLPAVGLSR
jgi:ribonuclease VapC